MTDTTRLSLPRPTGSDLISGGDDAITEISNTLDNALMFASGVVASRPAAADLAGRIYYATDTGAVFFSTGSAWLELSTGAPVPIGGAMDYAFSSDPDDTRFLLADGREISRATYATYAAKAAAAGYPDGAGNGTTTVNLPDLRGRGTVGPDNMGTGAGGAGRMASNNTLGASGGAETKTLATGNLPAHAHDQGSLGNSSDGSHDHAVGTLAVTGDGSHTHGVGTYAVSSASAGTPSGTVAANFAGPSNVVDQPHLTSFLEPASGTVTNYQPTGWASTSHAHAFTGSAMSAHGHGFTGASASATHSHGVSGSVAANGTHTHTISGSTGSVGSGTAFNIMHPYKVMNKIIRVL